MAGKSTLMRSTTVAALLTNCGLMAPVEGGTEDWLEGGTDGGAEGGVEGGAIPRYDSYFVRTASFDVPSEGKSAFAQESAA